MSGNGKYTVYAPEASTKNTLLNKLFGSNDAIVKPPTQDLVGKEVEAREAVLTIARQYLQPNKQFGDEGMFPNGVDLNFSGAPNLEDVNWRSAGDPANAYMPDISSPEPGAVEGVDKNVDPQIKTVDIKPNFVPGAPGTGTKSPSTTNAKIIAANILGVSSKLGDSGANT